MYRVRMTYVCLAIAAAASLLAVAPAQATIVVVEDYTFNDNAKPAGFTEYGTPTYSSGSLNLDGSSAIGIATPLKDTDNFGIEAIVTYSQLKSWNWLVANNDSSAYGFGIDAYEASPNSYLTTGAFQGFAVVGSATIAANTEYRLAFVVNNGTGTLYVNGVDSGSKTPSGSATLVNYLTIGASKTSNGLDSPITGSINEVRLFTFTGGAFNASTDLLTTATVTPEPSTLTLLVVGASGLLAYAWRKRR